MHGALMPTMRDLRRHLVVIEVVVEVVEVVCDDAHLEDDVKLLLTDEPAEATCSKCLAGLDERLGQVVPLHRRVSATAPVPQVGMPSVRSA